jgi:hypothetical protein
MHVQKRTRRRRRSAVFRSNATSHNAPPKKPKKPQQARQLALKRVLDQINYKHGAGAVMRLGQQPMQM